jgi:CheY-like chemotaxis protein
MANIMIVTDDEEVLNPLLAALRPDGHLAFVSGDVNSAIEKVMENLPDLLLLDTALPKDKAAAFDLAREIQKDESTRGLPIVLLTGPNDEYPFNFGPQDLGSSWLPVSALIEKPVDVPLLRQKISELLGKQRRKYRPGRTA